jgi:uncharacterized protein YecE (DUF72 family)
VADAIAPRPAPDLDAAHDPGFAAAGARAAVLVPSDAELAVAAPVRLAGAGRVLVGTASWTDPTITAGEIFYPRGVKTPEQRLRYYASRFPVVEVDSTYYALPARRVAELWAERTPDDFVFHVKAHALMTGQPTETDRLPRELREALPRSLADRKRVYAKDLPDELRRAVWEAFLDALTPLRDAGKLGAVLLQYPRWFLPTPESKDAILRARERLGGVQSAVELRNETWFGEDRKQTFRTLDFLAEHEIPYVMVDGPQGLASSVPPVDAVTSPRLAMVRLHGRRAKTWEAAGVPTVERYRYLYDAGELAEWVPKIGEAAKQAQVVTVLFNNCYGNYGTTNALEFTAMLEDRAAR